MESDTSENASLAPKIARLVEEKGWNQEDFARIAQVNRHTARKILVGGDRHRLRNATVGQCASALGLSVHELRTLSLDALLRRLRGEGAPADNATPPAGPLVPPMLREWLEKNSERASRLSADELGELTQMLIHTSALGVGVEHLVQLLERRRRLMTQVQAIAQTDQLPLLEQMVQLLHDRITQNRG